MKRRDSALDEAGERILLSNVSISDRCTTALSAVFVAGSGFIARVEKVGGEGSFSEVASGDVGSGEIVGVNSANNVRDRCGRALSTVAGAVGVTRPAADAGFSNWLE